MASGAERAVHGDAGDLGFLTVRQGALASSDQPLIFAGALKFRFGALWRGVGSSVVLLVGFQSQLPASRSQRSCFIGEVVGRPRLRGPPLRRAADALPLQDAGPRRRPRPGLLLSSRPWTNQISKFLPPLFPRD